MPGAVFLHASRVNGLLFLVLSHPLPPSHLLPAPPPPPSSSLFLRNGGLGESAGRTLNWKLVSVSPPPSPKFSPPVAGHWLFVFGFFFPPPPPSLFLLLFFWGGGLDIKLIITPALPAPPPTLGRLGISSIPMVQFCVLRLDKIGSPSYFTIQAPAPPPPLL